MILRCTGKLLRLLERRPVTLPTPAPSDDDWYANLLWLDRRKCLLLVHAGTLFSVFGADVRKVALTPIGDAIVGLVHTELVEEGLPWDTFGDLDPAAVILARTASRVVLRYMNEMAKYCEYSVHGAGSLAQSDIGSLNRGCDENSISRAKRPGTWFRLTPCSPVSTPASEAAAATGILERCQRQLRFERRYFVASSSFASALACRLPRRRRDGDFRV